MDLAPSATDHFAESASTITDSVPTLGNAAICVDSLCTTGRAGINFYCSPNPLSKVFFGASCVCGIIGAGSSGTAIGTSFVGIPVAGWIGSLGKYSLHMGNVTSGNITNATDIAKLIS